jgi:hypothetical protein
VRLHYYRIDADDAVVGVEGEIHLPGSELFSITVIA